VAGLSPIATRNASHLDVALHHRFWTLKCRQEHPTSRLAGRPHSRGKRRLHQLGLDRARVTAVATKPGQGSDLRFEHIPVAQIDALKKAIGG
jgi:hypothetical protein